MSTSNEQGREVGLRAEEVTEWYFRLNGFFLIPGFVVHPDAVNKNPRTEADLLGIRLKGSQEGIRKERGSGRPPGSLNPFRSMTDHGLLISPSRDGTVPKHLVAMVEVKAGECNINGPWSRKAEGNMSRALGRVGFGNQAEVTQASEKMYEDLRYVGRDFIVQYFTVGRVRSSTLAETYPYLVQITFDDIGEFLSERFSNFPEKIPPNSVFNIWRGFGYDFMRWFEQASDRGSKPVAPRQCAKVVGRYVVSGSVTT